MDCSRMRVDYTIVSKPVNINFICPNCDEDNEIPFEERFWEYHESVNCRSCGNEVLLGEWEYD